MSVERPVPDALRYVMHVLETGNRSPTVWHLRRDERREISDIFNVYRLKAEPILTRVPHAALRATVTRYVKASLTAACLALCALCYVYNVHHVTSDVFRIATAQGDNTGTQDNATSGGGLTGSAAVGSRDGTDVISSQRGQGRQLQDSPDTPVQKILLLTYFRGGSTFLGDVFNHNPAAFYWFEPLAAPMFEYKRDFHTKDYTVDSQEQAVTRPPDLVDGLLDIVQQVLDCDMDALRVDVLKHYFATKWHKSLKFARYQACLTRYRARRALPEVPVAAVQQCKKYLERQCQGTGMRVIKSIRLFVEEAMPLLHLDPDVRLIYYARDPRGILLSRWSLVKLPPGRIPREKVEQSASYLCAKMRLDLEMAARLRERYPDRVLTLRYEDLATAPVSTTHAVYRFLGAPLPQDVVDWVRQATHAAKSDGKIGTRRENATAVASRWRELLPDDTIDAINAHCSDVIDAFYWGKFGYSAEDDGR